MSLPPIAPDRIRILFLGSGTSTGVPFIACDCNVCRSDNAKDKRTRASVLISWHDGVTERNVLIDASTDLRQQVLRHRIKKIDAVLFTHSHADHIHGIDELRCFNIMNGMTMPCYASPYTFDRIRKMFDYIFDPMVTSLVPKLALHPMKGDFQLFGKTVGLLPAMHGNMEVLGFKIGPIAYITDCNRIPDQTVEKMRDVPLLVVGATTFESHPTHLSIGEAIEIAGKVRAGKTCITHLSHLIHHATVSAGLPENVVLAYDGYEETFPG